MAYTPAFSPDGTARNRLRQILTDPSSYSGSVGFQFGRDQGLAALDRKNSYIRNTPGADLEAMKFATGLAQQDYGSEVNRLAQIVGQEDQYDLGAGQNTNAAERNANDLALGHESNANTRYNTDANTGLGYFKTAADYSLGSEANANTRQNNQMNYELGQGRNANDAAQVFSNYDLGQGRNAIDWYNAGTNRGAAQSGAYSENQKNALNWYRARPRSGMNPVTGGSYFVDPGATFGYSRTGG